MEKMLISFAVLCVLFILFSIGVKICSMMIDKHTKNSEFPSTALWFGIAFYVFGFFLLWINAHFLIMGAVVTIAFIGDFCWFMTFRDSYFEIRRVIAREKRAIAREKEEQARKRN